MTRNQLDLLLKQERLLGRLEQLQIDITKDKRKLTIIEKRYNKKYGQS